MRIKSSWLAFALALGMALTLQARAAVFGHAGPIVDVPDDGEEEVLVVPMLDDEQLASFELVGFTYREDQGLGLVTRIEGVDGCRFRATLWEFAPAVGMSRDRSCDWATWVDENTRMVDPDRILPLWELPEYLEGYYGGGHYDPDGGDGPPADQIPSIKERIADEIQGGSAECTLASLGLAGGALLCDGTVFDGIGFGALAGPASGSWAPLAIGVCTLSIASYAAVLQFCYDQPVEALDLDAMARFLEAHEMLLDVGDVEDFLQFVDVEQLVREAVATP